MIHDVQRIVLRAPWTPPPCAVPLPTEGCLGPMRVDGQITAKLTEVAAPGVNATIGVKREREFFVDNLLVRIHLIVEMF